MQPTQILYRDFESSRIGILLQEKNVFPIQTADLQWSYHCALRFPYSHSIFCSACLQFCHASTYSGPVYPILVLFWRMKCPLYHPICPVTECNAVRAKLSSDNFHFHLLNTSYKGDHKPLWVSCLPAECIFVTKYV